MKKKKWLPYAIIATISVVLFFIWYFNETKKSSFSLTSSTDDDLLGKNFKNNIKVENDDIINNTTSNNDEKEVESETNKIKVHIMGEVLKDGVYEIEIDSRLEDLIALAGGLSEQADLTKINLSKKLSDEQKIVIPTIGEETNDTMYVDGTETINTSENSKTNINTASKNQLTNLNGIGESIADSIIQYRETNGGFKNIDEIKNVNRIGDKTFEGIKEDITVD